MRKTNEEGENITTKRRKNDPYARNGSHFPINRNPKAFFNGHVWHNKRGPSFVPFSNWLPWTSFEAPFHRILDDHTRRMPTNTGPWAACVGSQWAACTSNAPSSAAQMSLIMRFFVFAKYHRSPPQQHTSNLRWRNKSQQRMRGCDDRKQSVTMSYVLKSWLPRSPKKRLLHGQTIIQNRSKR